MTPQTPPIQLLARIVLKDREAFGRFYDLYAPLVYGIALKILRNPSDAEETAQDTFLYVWNRASSFEPARGKVETWLATLSRSRAIDRLRARNRREKNVDPISEDTDLGELAGQDPANRNSVGSRMDTDGFLDQVTEIQRQALELAYLEGLTQSEIAVKLDLPLGTVKTRIRDSLQKLRELVKLKEKVQ